MLAGSNTYGFGRLAWGGYGNVSAAAAINREWAQLTFPAASVAEVPSRPQARPSPFLYQDYHMLP